MPKLSQLAVGLAALLGVGVAIGLLAIQDDSEPRAPRVGVIEQDSVSSFGGIRIELSEATFSGADTTVLAIMTDAQGAHLTDVRVGEGPGLKECDFEPGAVKSIGATSERQVVLRLPPVLRPGRLSFTIQSIAVGPGEPIAGPWELTLQGPGDKDFNQTMRIEDLQGIPVEIAGNSVLVSVRRTSTRTIVSYILPDALLELSGPTIMLDDGTSSSALFRSDAGATRVLEFPPTDFGVPVRVAFGALATRVDRSSVVSIAFREFAQRNSLSPSGKHAGIAQISEISEAAVEGRDVLDGPSSLLLRAGYGFDLQGSTRRDVVHLVVGGNWHSQADEKTGVVTSPVVLDGSGKSVQLAGVNSAYSKNAAGDIGQGETTVTVIVTESTDLSRLTVALAAPFQVVGGHPTVTVSP